MQRAVRIGPIALCAGVFAVSPACAQTGLSTSATLVSDYRFRGISQSGRDPAIQGSIDYSARSGLFGGVWASSVDRDTIGAHAELDLYAGWAKRVGAWRYAVSGYGYFYPGTSGLATGEVQAEVGYTLGPVEARGFAAFAPSQPNATRSNVYLGGGLSVGIPRTALSATVKLGYEDGYYAGKLDWEASLGWVRGPVRVSAAYVDTNVSRGVPLGRLGSATVVASISVTK